MRTVQLSMHCLQTNYFRKTGKLILPVFFFLLLFPLAKTIGQIHEFGLGVGGLNYIGELNPRFNPTLTRPAGQVFYRFNSLNRVTAFKIALAGGQLAGNETNSKEPVAIIRQANFKSSIWDGSLMAEYNFINYRDRKQLLKFSPYLTTGIAFFTYNSTTKTNSLAEPSTDSRYDIALPIGLGIKFILNKNWNFNFESVARKTFTDYIDGISDADIGIKKTGNPSDSDWYFYTGISLSYTIYGIKCPQEYKY